MSGELDEVLQKKAETKKDKKRLKSTEPITHKDKTVGYFIIIEFHRGENVDSCEYHYDGYRILHYESGKKGVRFFSAVMMPKAKHLNLFNLATILLRQRKQGTSIYIWAIYRKMNYLKTSNWPTYYPYSMKADDIVHEMLYH
ncbi:ZinT/AdcA family metal-binding protein [Proteus sp. CD3]|uniref:ZinT/AdcA family metal-binding protein n=1 Tax=Proteus sp. CD3 TaxID=1921565 RepID=UPI00223EAC66|nr:ZinT/AdcA family metal-binding protein [Proteus sp. CD3]